MEKNASLKTRIIIALTVAITAVLTLYGAAETARIADEQRTRIDDRAKAVLTRLESTLPGPLWDFAIPTVVQIVRAELAARTVIDIRVYGVDGELVAGLHQLDNGETRSVDPKTGNNTDAGHDGSVYKRELIHHVGTETHPLGHVEVIADSRIVAERVRAAVWRLLAAVVSLDVIIVILVTSLINKLVLRPMDAITQPLTAVAGGDLTQRVLWPGRDEIGNLGRAVNSFIERVAIMVDEVQTAVSQFIESTGSSSATLQSLTERINQQQHDLTLLANHVRQLSESARAVVGHTADSTHTVSQAQNHATHGLQRIEAANTASRDLADSIHDASAVVSQLDQHATQISSIVEEINAIADQTNLLALNAAIEAARAGDNGRGFAVVADEVRNLSHRTQAATGQVKTVIEQLQAHAGRAVQRMSSGQSKAASTAQIMDEAHRAFLGIEAAIRNSQIITQKITHAGEQQDQTLSDVEGMLQGIVRVQQQTVEAARQSNAAGEGIRRTSERLRALIGRLSNRDRQVI